MPDDWHRRPVHPAPSLVTRLAPGNLRRKSEGSAGPNTSFFMVNSQGKTYNIIISLYICIIVYVSVYIYIPGSPALALFHDLVWGSNILGPRNETTLIPIFDPGTSVVSVFIGIFAPDPIQPVCLTSILWSIGKEHKNLMNAICRPPKRVSRLQSVGQRKSKTTYVLGGSI